MIDKNEKLPGDYVAGFVDGEGCFSLKFRKDKKKNKLDGKVREYLYWAVEFAIVLRADDVDILSLVKNTLNCGYINRVKGGDQIRFSVQSTEDIIKKVIPFFEKYNLRAKKLEDFKLWSEAARIMNKYRSGVLNVKKGKRGFVVKPQISKQDSSKLFDIREKMVVFKAARSRDFKWGDRPKEG